MPKPASNPRRSRLGANGGGLLDEIEQRFQLLCAGPQPLSVDGTEIGHGLPRRLIPLPELAAILMHPSCGFEARDAVWRLLVERARTGDAAWVVGAVGVLTANLHEDDRVIVEPVFAGWWTVRSWACCRWCATSW
jgi:hypothetical protein